MHDNRSRSRKTSKTSSLVFALTWAASPVFLGVQLACTEKWPSNGPTWQMTTLLMALTAFNAVMWLRDWLLYDKKHQMEHDDIGGNDYER